MFGLADIAPSRRFHAEGRYAYGVGPPALGFATRRAAEVGRLPYLTRIVLYADVAQLVEQDFRKVKVGGSIPLIGLI